jgi:hypothetical protein
VEDRDTTPDTETAYQNTADKTSASKAFDLYERHELQVQTFDTDGVVSAQVWGPCPRCGHELNIQMTLNAPIAGLRSGWGAWAALTRRDVPVPSGKPAEVEVGCGCGYTHPGAPEQVTGCGVSFRLPATPLDTPGTPR